MSHSYIRPQAEPSPTGGYAASPYTLAVADMTCRHCAASVEQAVRAVPGVTAVKVDLDNGSAEVAGGQPDAVMTAIETAGYQARLRPKVPDTCALSASPTAPVPTPGTVSEVRPAADGGAHYLIRIADMTCSSCVAAVERAIRSVPGVTDAAVNLVEQSAAVVGGDPRAVIDAVVDQGYNASLPEPAATAPTEAYEIAIADMTCSSCVARVEKAIRSMPGVTEAAVNLVERKAWVVGGDAQKVAAAIVDQGYPARPIESIASNRLRLRIADSDAPAPAARVRAFLQRTGESRVLSQKGQTWEVVARIHPADLLLALRDAGFDAAIEERFVDPYVQQAQAARREIHRAWRRALLAGLVGFGLMAAQFTDLLPALTAVPGPFGLGGQAVWGSIALLCLVTMWYSGGQYYATALKQARHRAANMDTLVALGTGAAWIASLLVIVDPDFIPGGGNHLYLDTSVLILAFLQFGHALETRAKRTTGEAIGSLVELAPRIALVVRGTREVELPVSLLRVGDQVRVKPGQKVPIDGRIQDGGSNLDESMLTGEPMPVAKGAGELVIGGSINGPGSFLFQVTRLGDETTLAQIVRLVRQAQLGKPPIGRLVDRVAGVFVPIVIAIALGTSVLWLLAGPEPRLAYALTASIAVLVIACPCALGLATPIAIMVGTARAAQMNILIRNGEALQTTAGLTHLVMDKTGTLTEGRPRITRVLSTSGETPEQLLQWAAGLEQRSEHPLAAAILAAARERGLEPTAVSEFTAVAGRGVQARADGRTLRLGNRGFMQENGIRIDDASSRHAETLAAQAATPVWLAADTRLLGLLALQDPVRADTPAAVEALQRRGITLVMCTGDHQATAKAVARDLGIATVHSEVMPEDKLEVVKALQQAGHKVGMVGDGVNDAPALMQADTGFAIGGGTDVAIDNADITLASDSLATVEHAIAISRGTLRNIRQNLFGAFVYNSVGIPLAAGALFPWTGWLLQPMFASAAMAMSSVTVVTNANRLRWFKPSSKPKPKGDPQMASVTLKVTGMTCQHCVSHVTKALQGVSGVEKVAVSLEPGQAVVEGNAAVPELVAAVKQAGYTAST